MRRNVDGLLEQSDPAADSHQGHGDLRYKAAKALNSTSVA